MKTSPKLLGLAAAALVCAVPALAQAETPHTHDGFYFRLALGAGYAADSFTVKSGPVSFDGSIKGGGVATELMFGGTLAPGLVLGGGLQNGAFPKPRVKFGSVEGDGTGTLQLSTIGPFVDYYLDPHAGFHVQGFLGLAVLSGRDSQGRTSTKNPSGGVISVGVGQDWWVSDAWSIGILGRLQLARTSYSEGGADESHTTVVPAVMASFTYH